MLFKHSIDVKLNWQLYSDEQISIIQAENDPQTKNKTSHLYKHIPSKVTQIVIV